MGEYADEAVERAMYAMERLIDPSPEAIGRRERERRKKAKIRAAGLKQTRQLIAIMERADYCLNQLPDLEDDDD